MHADASRRHQRQAVTPARRLQEGQTLAVEAVAQQFHRQPAPPIEQTGKPLQLCFVQREIGRRQKQRQASRQAIGQIVPAEMIATLGGTAPALGNEAAEAVVATAVTGQQHQPRALAQTDLAADEQL